MSPHSSATLVPVQLTQFWQDPSDGFSRLVRLLCRHRRRGVAGFRKDESTSVKRIKETDDPVDGAKNPRWIELSERRGAFDQSNLGPPHPREVKLGLCDSAGALEHDCILGVAGDFANELVQLFRKRRGRGDAQGQAMPVGVAARSVLTRARNGDRCSCARCDGWRQFAARSPWSGRR
jgi:hypothetical protein